MVGAVVAPDLAEALLDHAMRAPGAAPGCAPAAVPGAAPAAVAAPGVAEDTGAFRDQLESILRCLHGNTAPSDPEFAEAVRLLHQWGDAPQTFGARVLSAHAKRISQAAGELHAMVAAPAENGEEAAAKRLEVALELFALKSFLFKFDSGRAELRRSPPGRPLLTWPNLLYVMQTYAMMMAMVMCAAFFVGMMMGLFLFVMSQVDDEAPVPIHRKGLAALVVVFLPGLLLAGSLGVFNSILLLAGQSHSVSFARSRALMVGALVKLKIHWANKIHQANQKWVLLEPHVKRQYVKDACRLTDMWFNHIFFASTLAVALLAFAVTLVLGRHMGWFALLVNIATYTWGSAMSVASLWAFFTIVLYSICDVWVSNGKFIRRAVDATETAILKYNVRPGSMESHVEVIFEWLALDIGGQERQQAAGGEVAEHVMELIRSIVAVVLLVVLVAVIVLTSMHRLPFFGRSSTCVKLSLVIAWVTLALFALAYLLRRHITGLMSPKFFVPVLLAGAVLDLALVTGVDASQPLFHGRPVPVPLAGGAGAWVYENRDRGANGRGGERPPYPACLMRWGAREELRVLDLAILSSYAYDPDDASYLPGGAVWTNASAAFAGGGLEAAIVRAEPYHTVGRVVAFRFTAGGGPGTTVLVVKGSSEAFDFYADAGLWSMISVFQAFMLFVPLLDQLPNQLFAGILYLLPRTGIEKQIFADIHEIRRELAARFPGDAFLIAGHSLGGGIATAAGGSIGIPAVSFSGPGSHFSRWRFGTSMEGAYRSALTVKPEIDVVHKIDRHDEAGQYIECRDPRGEKRDAGTCHLIGTTICELWRACGDHRGRDFRMMCQELLGDTWSTSHNGLYLSLRGR